MEYRKGEYVKYSSNGVCLISDICTPDFEKSSENILYYILSPVSDKSTTVFVPVNNTVLVSKMRTLLTKQEIDEMIASIKSVEIKWVDDRKKRSDLFSDILKENNVLDLLRMVGCIYMKKQQLAEANGNRKLSLSDIDALERAEKLIEDEFAFVLDIDIRDVGEYIRKKLED